MEFQTIKELYANSIRTYGNRPSFSMLERESMTYNDFDDRVEYVRGILLGAGLGSGDKVALLSSNMPNWNVCYFAIVTSGMIAVPILPDFSGSELDTIIAHSEAKALFVSDKLYSRLSKETVERMNIVVRTKNLGIIARTSSELGVMTEPKPDDLAVIIYTSGTTSSPKGVMLTHRSIAAQIQMDRDLFFVRPDDIFLSILPLSHTYECSLGMLLPFMCGASVVYVDRPPTASNLLPALRQVRPTVMLSVPLVIEKIYKSQVAARFRSSRFLGALYARPFFRKTIHRIAGRRLYKLFGGRLRFFGIGGAKLDTEAERFLLEGRFPYAIGYGLTETAPLIAGAVPSNVRLGSTGPVLPGIEARLEDTNELGEGELVVKSPCTMLGYYKNPELTAEALSPDGWFRTRDLCAFDADGFLYVRGRLGSMIVGPNGENIYPEDIESVLNSHFLISDSVVTQDKGKLVALVRFDRAELEKRYHEFRDDLAATMEDIKADIIKYVNSKVNKSSKIATIEEQEHDFEKTPSHKIKRYLYTRKSKEQEEENRKTPHEKQ
ncbi:MAG TPA: AMP-binding protein [Candidatus Tidjanibacter gallistercoris]|nr:AMP-binding protein [Candidatus Tidjanibacter gallistercoris]